MIELVNINQELSDLPEGWIVLLETTAEKSLESSLASINTKRVG